MVFYEANHDYKGNGVLSCHPCTSYATAEECSSGCAADHGANFFTFGENVPQLATQHRGNCWCKSSNAGRTGYSGLTSGIASRQPRCAVGATAGGAPSGGDGSGGHGTQRRRRRPRSCRRRRQSCEREQGRREVEFELKFIGGIARGPDARPRTAPSRPPRRPRAPGRVERRPLLASHHVGDDRARRQGRRVPGR